MTYDPERDHYKVLRVRPDASFEALKLAHRKVSRRHHPDFHPGDPKAEEVTKRVNAAWHTLRDPDRRRAYDEERAAFRAGRRKRPTTSTPVRAPRSSPATTAPAYDPWAPRPRAGAPAVDPVASPRRDVPPLVRLSVERASRSSSPARAVGWVLFGVVASTLDASARRRRR